jgi:hypothetical protein
MIAAIKGAQAAKGAYKEMSPKQKQATQIMGVVVVLGALYLGNKVVSGMGKGFDFITGADAEKKRKIDEAKFKTQVQKDLVRGGVKPTLTEARAKSTAQALFSAMDGMGTDEANIIGAMQVIKNSADYQMVVLAYGMPNKLTLTAELYKELNHTEMRVIKAILERAGVEI